MACIRDASAEERQGGKGGCVVGVWDGGSVGWWECGMVGVWDGGMDRYDKRGGVMEYQY
jgi:hypothetical protein